MQTFRGLIALVACPRPDPRAGARAARHGHAHARRTRDSSGSVHFPTSCKPELQPAFDRAVALLHSFAYAEAAKAFAEVAAKDSACAWRSGASR